MLHAALHGTDSTKPEEESEHKPLGNSSPGPLPRRPTHLPRCDVTIGANCKAAELLSGVAQHHPCASFSLTVAGVWYKAALERKIAGTAKAVKGCCQGQKAKGGPIEKKPE